MENRVEITGCEDCPLCQSEDNGRCYCRAIWSVKGSEIPRDEKLNPITPEWCPLKEGDFVIAIKK